MNDLFSLPQYSLTKEQKIPLLLEELNLLTLHHIECCPSYARLLQTLQLPSPPYKSLTEIPYLPVSLFKKRDLSSVPHDEVYKTLLSSGTTGSIPSKIYLDRKTAQMQTAALAAIMTHLLGQKRLPMLIIEEEEVIKDPKMFSARGAALIGMLNFGRDPLYLLDKEGKVKRKALLDWSLKYREGPVLIFGLTFMVWKYFLEALEPHAISLPSGILLHTGGWKKLQDISVSNEDFKAKALAAAGIQKCHNFYGFVEQVGSVFVECEKGLLHSPNFAEVVIRDSATWNEARGNTQGVIQTISTLPWSYPGHSLLTEDLGRIERVDDCPCGRKGKGFKVLGRIPRAEPRGCSDVTTGR